MRLKRAAACILSVLSMLSMFGCGTPDANEPYTFKNAGFESGTLRNWTAEGDAFANACVEASITDENGDRFYQEGDFFLYGKRAGNSATGFLRSETFELKGNGQIGFLIGAGENADKSYIALCTASDDKEVLTKGNDGFDRYAYPNALRRAVMDAKNYVGKKVYMKIVDNDHGNTGFNYINADDFIIGYEGTADDAGKLFMAEKYIEANKSSVNGLYRHTYHAMPPVGWMNDPNGVAYAFGKYHLFYQFHPYSSAWGPMHWGHYTSSDMVKWEYAKTALAPDRPYDAEGCFSGTSILADGKFYLMYTSVANGLQTQSLAVSDDGINFHKAPQNPVIPTNALPSGARTQDFRDPKVFKRGNFYYCIVGSRHNDGDGQLLLYRSPDLYNWTYVGTPYKDNRTNGIYECPDFFTLDGADILLLSPQDFGKNGNLHENIHSNIYMAGFLNHDNGSFQKTYEGEIDGGFDFYAPQTLLAPDGRRIMIAWMQMWDRTLPTQTHNWAGATTLPRELTFVGGKLIQSPIREIEAYRKNEIRHTNVIIEDALTLSGVEGRTVELVFEIDMMQADRAGVKIFKDTGSETLIYYDRARGAVVFDRSGCGVRISGAETSATVRVTDAALKNNKIKFRIFLDKSSAEVFINDGEQTMTGNVYSQSASGIEFFSSGGHASLTYLDKYDIIV